jgi:cation diffusion facilitator CzcD-associated flavoprotein CzcO
VPREERLAKWEQLYGEPGFGIWLANFRDTFMDEAANAELSEFIAGKIRSRVDDPVLAEKLIPKDHGFGVQRVPMETRYYEAYNRPNVHLVDLKETPIERITPDGIETTDGKLHELDIIIYATGFDAVTGAYDRIDIRGVGGQSLRDKWRDGPKTFLGMQVAGFPNMLMPSGPQSGSASTNYPRGIELGVDWVTDLLQYIWQHDLTRAEADPQAEQEWGDHVRELYGMVLMRKAQGWFTGYNSNVDGHEQGTIRYLVYNGGTPKYRKTVAAVADEGYAGIALR